MTGGDDLSAEAQALDARARETIDTLTSFETAPKPPVPAKPPWWKLGRGWEWLVPLAALILLVVGILFFGWFGGDESESADPPGTPSPPTTDTPATVAAGGRWYFYDPATERGLYTIDLLGDGQSGPIDVLEDQTDQGTFTWEGPTLTITFTRVMTMPSTESSTTFQFEEPSSFVCDGGPEARRLDCTYRRQAWRYDPSSGLTVEGTDEVTVAAERR